LRKCAGAEARGISRDSLFASSLIQPIHCDDRDRVTPAQYLLLMMNVGRSVEDAALGLGSFKLRLGYSALALRCMLGCATLGGALRAVSKFYCSVGSALQMDVHLGQDEAEVSVRCESPINGATVLEDTGLAWIYICCTYFLGRALPVSQVITRDPGHFDLGELHWAACAPVRLGPVAQLRFSRAVLASRRSEHNSDSVFADCVSFWLRLVEEEPQFPWSVSSDSCAPHVRLDALASRAKVSVSTLRRRLEQDVGGFRFARRRALADIGIAMLKAGDVSVEEIAGRLGYSDARSFRRFLKSATGLTPQEFRQPVDPALTPLDARAEVRARLLALTSLLDC